jgi:UPF0176 protein
VDPTDWHQVLGDPETLLIDTRNDFEVALGSFPGAINPKTACFSEFAAFAAQNLDPRQHKKIAMFCTGGIRCEKASAYLMHRGFKNVFHLEGGIIHYANQVKEKNIDNKFHGKNFVFDNRLGERITDEIIARCHQCGKPADTHVNCINSACHLLFIQCDECKIKYDGCCSKECQDVIHMPEEKQKEIRKGIDKGSNIFNKSKSRLRPKLKPPEEMC